MSDGNSSVHRRRRSERDQLDLFRALPGDLAPGEYQVVVGLYDPVSGAPVGEFVTVGEVSLP